MVEFFCTRPQECGDGTAADGAGRQADRTLEDVAHAIRYVDLHFPVHRCDPFAFAAGAGEFQKLVPEPGVELWDVLLVGRGVTRQAAVGRFPAAQRVVALEEGPRGEGQGSLVPVPAWTDVDVDGGGYFMASSGFSRSGDDDRGNGPTRPGGYASAPWVRKTAIVRTQGPSFRWRWVGQGFRTGGFRVLGRSLSQPRIFKGLKTVPVETNFRRFLRNGLF